MTPGALTPRPIAACPACGASTEGRPFCPRDGAIIAPVPLRIGGRYDLDELIGGGGFGFVYGARHVVLGKPVAVKVLRPEYARDDLQRTRFLREARTASQLVHEHIVGVLDVGFAAEHEAIYLVMERLRGGSLADRLAGGRGLPVARALPILLQIARALAAAHAGGVVHRDLNPRNVLLASAAGDDVVKLCDFGLSRLASGRDRLTGAGVVLGTPAYMAPEQLRGDPDQDHRVDLHAFGITAFELLTGRRPIDAATAAGLIAKKLATDPERTLAVPLEGVPAEVEDLIMRCLEREPAARPASADELIAVIAPAVAGVSAGGAGAAGPVNLVGQRVGHYVIKRLIETGGIGSVYEGEHPIIGSRVAVKVLLPEVIAIPGMSERFILEARASSRIVSPHMPRYHDFGHLPGGRPYAVMELLDGETVAERVARDLTVPVAEVAEIVRQLASVLELAHRAAIVHRDVKPENIFLTRGEDGALLVKLLDFGIAKVLAAGDAGRTGYGVMLGTPAYCAPEQALGLEIGPAADVYGLGATAFEMLSGAPPFDGEIPQILGAKTTREAPALTGVPDEVRDTVAAMLVRDRAGRIASMAEVRERVAAWAAPPVVPVIPPIAQAWAGEGGAEVAEPRSRRRGWRRAAGAAAAVVVLGIVTLRACGTGEVARVPAPLLAVETPAVAPIAVVPMPGPERQPQPQLQPQPQPQPRLQPQPQPQPQPQRQKRRRLTNGTPPAAVVAKPAPVPPRASSGAMIVDPFEGSVRSGRP